jgi:hypothetical protein
MANTDKDYYQETSNWGEDQYVKLSDVINNFMIINVGDNKLINEISRFDIIFHAKRGLQELHYDALNDVRAIEMEMPDTLQVVLPRDYVRLIRVSWVDGKGKLHPMTTGNFTTSVNQAFLQDDQGGIIFSDGANEEALEGTPLMDIRNMQVAENQDPNGDPLNNLVLGGRFGMDTVNANVNGTYNVNKSLGVIRFSSDVAGKLIVIEYITDGLSNMAESDLKIHKLAEDYLYKYILHEVIRNKYGVQEYIVRRIKKDVFASLKNTKIRMMDIHPLDLLMALKGKNKWIK